MHEENYPTMTCDMDSEDEALNAREYYLTAITAPPDFPIYEPPPFVIQRPGIREASMRHDVLARKKYYKPFKSFKFNRARRQRP